LKNNEQLSSEASLHPSPDSVEEATRRYAWTNSLEFRKGSYSFIIQLIGVAIAIWQVFLAGHAARISMTSFHVNWAIEWPYFLTALFTLVITRYIAILIRSYYRSQYDDRQLLESQAKLAGAEARLAEAGELDLPSLWEITHKRLDYYHEIATTQARRSFRNAQLAMSIGFLILVGAVAISYDAKSTVGTVVTGVLGGMGATLASYIGRTFIRAQESTAENLRSYFMQPLEFSRFLAAERLLDTLQGDAKNVAAEQLILQIARVPERPAPPPSS
jgi:hypothetical protein